MHSLPERPPADVHQSCIDLQIDENHVQTIFKLLFFVRKSHRFSTKYFRSNFSSCSHEPVSIPRESLDLDSILRFLFCPPPKTHRRRLFPSTSVRQFSNRALSCKPSTTASDSPSFRTPRDLRQHSTLRPPCIAFRTSCRLRFPSRLSVPNHKIKICHRFENHLIVDFMLRYGSLSKFQRPCSFCSVMHNCCPQSYPWRFSPLSFHLRNQLPGAALYSITWSATHSRVILCLCYCIAIARPEHTVASRLHRSFLPSGPRPAQWSHDAATKQSRSFRPLGASIGSTPAMFEFIKPGPGNSVTPAMPSQHQRTCLSRERCSWRLRFCFWFSFPNALPPAMTLQADLGRHWPSAASCKDHPSTSASLVKLLDICQRRQKVQAR